MEQLSRNFHSKLQEMCDCYLDSDFLAELARPIDVTSVSMEDEALRYFALLILYTLTVKAQQLTVKKKDGTVTVTVSSLNEKQRLAPPPIEVASKVFEIIRAITHIEKDKGELTLALGLRNERGDLQVKLKRTEEGESLKVLFPEL